MLGVVIVVGKPWLGWEVLVKVVRQASRGRLVIHESGGYFAHVIR